MRISFVRRLSAAAITTLAISCGRDAAAELDNFDEGLFTGSGGPVTTVYLASTSKFQGNDVGPTINNAGQIAFEEDLDNGRPGIFLASSGTFTTIALNRAPISGFLRPPSLNDNGVAGFMAFLIQGGNEAVFRGSGGPLGLRIVVACTAPTISAAPRSMTRDRWRLLQPWTPVSKASSQDPTRWRTG